MLLERSLSAPEMLQAIDVPVKRSEGYPGQQYWIAISLGHEEGGMLTAAKLTKESSSVGLVTFALLIVDVAGRFFGQAKGTVSGRCAGEELSTEHG